MLYNVMLVSAVQQSESARCIHSMSSLLDLSPFLSSHPSRSSQSTGLSSFVKVFALKGLSLHLNLRASVVGDSLLPCGL